MTLPNFEGKENRQECEYQKKDIGDNLTDCQPFSVNHISLLFYMARLKFSDHFNLSKSLFLIKGAKMNVKFAKHI